MAEGEAVYPAAGSVGQGDEDQADGFLGRSAGRAGDAGDGQCVIGLGAHAAAVGHGFGDRGADGAVGFDRLSRYAQQVQLGAVGIGYQAADEVGAIVTGKKSAEVVELKKGA